MIEPTTIQLLRELADSFGTTSELSAALNLKWKDVAGALSNMRKQGYLTAERVPGAIGAAQKYSITPSGRARLRRWDKRSKQMGMAI